MFVSLRETGGEGEGEGERERTEGNWSYQVDWRGELRRHLKSSETPVTPHQELLYRFENLFISTIILNILTLCLGSCALLGVVALSSQHLPASSDITKILQQALPWLQPTAQQCSACNCLHWQQPYHTQAGAAAAQCQPEDTNYFLQYVPFTFPALKISSPKLGSPQEQSSREIEIVIITNIH